MKRTKLSYRWTAILLAGLCVVLMLSGRWTLASSIAPDQGFRTQLLGTWRVVAAEDRANEQSAWEHWYGLHPSGYFIYDTTGHVSIQICPDPPPAKFVSGDDFTPTANEAMAAYTHYLAYFGTYTVDEKRHLVTHHVEGSLLPSYTKTDQLRPYVLEGNRLELGDGKTWRRVLERVN